MTAPIVKVRLRPSQARAVFPHYFWYFVPEEHHKKLHRMFGPCVSMEATPEVREHYSRLCDEDARRERLRSYENYLVVIPLSATKRRHQQHITFGRSSAVRYQNLYASQLSTGDDGKVHLHVDDTPRQMCTECSQQPSRLTGLCKPNTEACVEHFQVPYELLHKAPDRAIK